MKTEEQFHIPRRPDELIHKEILWNLSQNGVVDGREFDVFVEEGRVVLKGEVFSKVDKKRAEALLNKVTGIVHIENKLKIARVSRFTDEHSMHGF